MHWSQAVPHRVEVDGCDADLASSKLSVEIQRLGKPVDGRSLADRALAGFV